MNKEAAREDVQRLVGEALVALTNPTEIGRAIDQAVMPDTTGRLPSNPAWEPTYCPYWAASVLVGWISIRQEAQGAITKFTAEGATFERALPNFGLIAAQLREQSPIMHYIGSRSPAIPLPSGSGGYDARSQSWPGVISNAN